MKIKILLAITIVFIIVIFNYLQEDILSQPFEEIESIQVMEFTTNRMISLSKSSLKEVVDLLKTGKIKTYKFVYHADSIQSDPKYIIYVKYINLEVDELRDGEGVDDLYRMLKYEDYVEINNDLLEEFLKKQFED